MYAEFFCMIARCSPKSSAASAAKWQKRPHNTLAFPCTQYITLVYFLLSLSLVACRVFYIFFINVLIFIWRCVTKCKIRFTRIWCAKERKAACVWCIWCDVMWWDVCGRACANTCTAQSRRVCKFECERFILRLFIGGRWWCVIVFCTQISRVLSICC